MADEQTSSVTQVGIAFSIECSDAMSARSDSDQREEPAQRSLSLGSPTRAVGTVVGASLAPSHGVFIRSASVDDGDPSNDDELVASPVSSQNSTDLLAKEYDEMRLTDSSDDEQPNGDSDTERVHRHARKIARGYLEIKKDFEKLKAKHESHWTFAEAVQNEKSILTIELTRSDQEKSKLKERIQQLEAMGDMLQYGAQGKCGVCNKSCKIIDSHPYSRVVLETVFGANYSGIFDLQQDQFLQPTSCKWKHLCGKCDGATGTEEKKFKDYLESVLEGSEAATGEKILQSHADLFHVYTFRAILRNIDTHHYIPGLEENQRCACSDLLHSLNNFRKRAHHLSKPFIWPENRPENQLINPFEAWMLFHICTPEVSPDHWIEFPLICKVLFRADQRSHYIIFAQIPPFYWAFPLPLEEQDVPNTISDDMITSEILVKTHFKEAMSDASQLSGDFERIIVSVNNELKQKRKLLDSRLQNWRDDLKKKKEEVLKEGDELEAEKQAYKKEQDELYKRIDKIEEEREENKILMKDVRKKTENQKLKEKEACITNEKTSSNYKLGNLAADLRKITRNNQELSKREIDCNDMLEKNASKQEELYTRKLNLIKKGLYADLEPKLMIGYFRAVSPCYLEIEL